MPYSKMEEVPKAWRTHKDVPLTLAQVNELAAIYDAIKQEGKAENPAAAALAQWEKGHVVKDGAWAKKETSAGKEDLAAADPDSGELTDVEILSTGTWKGFKITEDDLDNFVENFSQLPLKVPLKLGHTDKQKYAQREGRPAFGWIKNIKRVGTKLTADIGDIPKKLVELVLKKHWIRFSSEIIKNYRYRGNIYQNVLTGLALLGEELPAVQTLDDIYNLHSAKAVTYSDELPEGDVILLDSKDNEKGGNEDMEKVEQLQKDLEASKAKFSEANAQLEKQKADNAELMKKVEFAEKSAKTEKIYLAIDESIKAMKIPPAAKEIVAALALKSEGLIEEKHTFSEDGKETSIDAKDAATLIAKLAEVLPKSLNTEPASRKTGEKGEGESEGDDEEIQSGRRTYSSGAELDKKIRTVMKEQNIEYAEAYEVVAAQQESEV